MSRTRSPANGSAVDPAAGGGPRRRRTSRRSHRWSPGRAGGPVRGVEGARRRAGRAVAGSRTPSRGFPTNVSRVPEVLEVVTLEPLAIGAFGIRKADARSSTSSTVCAPIHASMVGASAVRSRKSFGSSIHSGCSTMAQKSSHCCPVPHPRPTSPSRAAPTPGVGHESLLPHRSAELVVEGHRVIREAHRQRLEHRHVDEFASRFGAPARAPGSRSRRTRRRATRRSGHPRRPGHGRVCPEPARRSAPDHACSVNSVAALSLQGPSSPNGVIAVTVRCGCRAEISPGASVGCSATGEPRDHTAASAEASSLSKEARLSPLVASTTTLRFEAPRKLKSAPSRVG